MNGTIGMMCACEACGKEIFRKAVGGRYLLDKASIRYECGKNVFLREKYGEYINQDGHMFIYPDQYEDLPAGWSINDNGDPICPRCMVKSKHGESALETIWARLGVTIYVMKAQYDIIMGDNYDKAEAELKAAINEGRYEPDGDSYIPMHGRDDIEFDI